MQIKWRGVERRLIVGDRIVRVIDGLGFRTSPINVTRAIKIALERIAEHNPLFRLPPSCLLAHRSVPSNAQLST
jgi:hypothetical protein